MDSIFLMNKYKKKSFKEVAEILKTNDSKYLNYIKKYLLRENIDNEKKDNIIKFLEYYENGNENEKMVVEEEKSENDNNEILEEDFIPKIIKLNGSKMVRNIYHISDIHIRRFQRFEEYNEVFNRLYNFLKSENNDDAIIAITGDLLHSKTDLSPECIMNTYNFLKNLSDILPTFLIAGNHDALLTNNQRLDSISPIIDIGDLPNLYYLKDSNVYEYGNISIAVCSLLDSKWIYSKNYTTDKLKICFYHGGVGEIETDVGYRLKGEKLITDFDGYDYVLLGDIHKHYFLDKEKKKVAYASSLICQNFNEWNTDHGVLKWDIINKEHKYINIKNNYGYYIISIINDKIYIDNFLSDENYLLENIKDMNKSLNLKIHVKNSLPLYIKSVVKNVQKLISDLKVQYNFIYDENSSNTNDDFDSDIKFDNDSLFKWLEYYLKKKNIDNGNDISFIQNIFSNSLKETELIRDKSLSRWSFIDLHFSNMFGYGEDNYIDFSRFSDNSLIGLVAPNSFGKSSLIDIVLFTLFGRISRNQSHGVPKDIINIEKDTFSTKLRFKIGSDIFILEKNGRREATGKIKILKEEFYKLINGEKKILTEESRIKTDKEVIKYIGTMDEFIFTNIQLQSRTTSFKDMTNKEKKDFLFHILKLDLFENINKNITQYVKETKKEFDYLKKKIKLTDIDVIKKSVDTKKDLYSTILNKIEDYDSKINGITNSLSEEQKKLKPVDTTLLNLTVLDIQKKIEDSIKIRENIENRFTIVNNSIENIVLEKKNNKYIDKEEDIVKLNDEFELNKKNKIKKLKKEIKSKSLKSIENYDSLKDELDINTEINIELINNSISTLEDENKNKNIFKKKIKDLSTKLITLVNEKNENSKNLENLNIDIGNIKESLWNFDAYSKKILKKDITDFEKDINKYVAKIKSCENEIQTYTGQLNNFLKSKDKIESKLVVLENLKGKIDIIDKEKLVKLDIKKLEDKIDIHKGIYEKLKSHKYNPKCKFCMNNTVVLEANKSLKIINSSKEELKELNKKITIDKKEEDKIYTEYNSLKKYVNKKDENAKKISLTEKILLKNNEKINSFKYLKNDYVKDMENFEKLKKNNEDNKEKQNNIKSIESKIKILSDKNLQISKEQNSTETDIEEINNRIIKNEKLLEKWLKLREFFQKNEKILKENGIIETEIKKIEDRIEELDNSVFEDYVELLKEKKINEDFDKKMLDLKNEQIEILQKKMNIEKKITGYNDTKKRWYDNCANKEENQKIEKIVKDFQDEINSYQLKLGDLNENKGSLQNRIESYEKEIKEYEEDNKDLKSITKEYNLLKILEEAVGRDGIPLLMLEKFLPQIENSINGIISSFISREVKLKIDKEHIIFESFPNKLNKSVLIHGGMEGFIMDLAFKITLSKFALLPKSDILFLDEGISAFDKEKLNSIDTLFTFLKSYFNKIVLITHIETINESFEEKIEIIKKNNLSNILCHY